MISHKIKRQLELVDWDFTKHLPGTTKSIHWYPGTYPADVPTTIIQALSGSEDLVFDPYGGVGTTVLEAIRQGRKGWAVEANPIGSLATYVAGGLILLKSVDSKLVPLVFEFLRESLIGLEQDRGKAMPGLLERDNGFLEQINSIISSAVSPGPEHFIENFQASPCLESLVDWFEKTTLEKLININELAGEAEFRGFPGLIVKAMLSSILRSCSSQIKSWGHIADNVKPKEFVAKDVYALARKWLTKFESMVRNTDVSLGDFEPESGVRLFVSLHSWGDNGLPAIVPPQLSSLMVTSPPYAGAIDYTLAQRLSLYMFGFADDSVSSLCKREIGARRKRFMSTSTETWARELQEALKKQVELIAQPGFAAFVLPHKDAGRDLGTQLLTDCLFESGWQRIIEVDRSIRQGRARQSWTSIKRETLHIFGK
ncbi:DNA methyltransferase [Pseudomonas sp. RT6P73]